MKVTDINLQDRRIFSCDRICKVHAQEFPPHENVFIEFLFFLTQS